MGEPGGGGHGSVTIRHELLTDHPSSSMHHEPLCADGLPRQNGPGSPQTEAPPPPPPIPPLFLSEILDPPLHDTPYMSLYVCLYESM